MPCTGIDPLLGKETEINLEPIQIETGHTRYIGTIHGTDLVYELILPSTQLDDEGNELGNEENQSMEFPPTEDDFNFRQTIFENEGDDLVIDSDVEFIQPNELEENNETNEEETRHEAECNIIEANQRRGQQSNEEAVHGTHSRFICDAVLENLRHRGNLAWDDTDAALIELYNIHRKCRAPIGLFDKTIDWIKKHKDGLINKRTGNIFDLPSRKVFVQKMYRNVYSKERIKNVRPKVVRVPVPDIDRPITTNVTVISFREGLIDLLSNEEVMDPNNHVFYDDHDPTKIHPVGTPFGETMTSDVTRRAHLRMCKNQNDVLWPIAMYNDEINFDKLNNHQLDPWSFTFLRLKVKIRNQPFAWRYFGMVHGMDSNVYKKDKKFNTSAKMTVYHTVLKKLLEEVKEIQDEGGIPWNYKLKDGSTRKVTLKIYLQYIIGDCEGHDRHCGRMKGHGIGMKGLLRDCNVSPGEADNINHECSFHKVSSFRNYTDDQCKQLSFHCVKNAFWDLDMGCNLHGVYGATPGEDLHILGSGLYPYMVNTFLSELNASMTHTIDEAIIKITYRAERQFCKVDFPRLNAFRKGVSAVKFLTANEKYSKVFALYLCLMSPSILEKLSKSKRITSGDSRNQNEYGIQRAKKWLELFESTLVMQEWFKLPIVPADQLYSTTWLERWKTAVESGDENQLPTEDDDMIDDTSLAHSEIKRYMKLYFELVKGRGGNNLKIPKFHLLLHYVRNIVRHGLQMNYNTSRQEANAKDLAKCPGLRTQMHHKSLSIQTANRYHEDVTMLEAERLVDQCRNGKFMYDKQCRSSYSYFNYHETSHSTNDNINQCQANGSKYTLSLIDRPTQQNTATVKVRWDGVPPSNTIDSTALYCLMNWLWFNPIGGCITRNSICNGFTELQKNGFTYRCHPSYRSATMDWYDWAYVKWEGYDEPIVGRIVMFFNLNNCDFRTEEEMREDMGIARHGNTGDFTIETTEDTTNSERRSTFISDHKLWAVLHSALESSLHQSRYSRFESKSAVAKRVEMEKGKFRVVPVEAIVEPAFAFMDPQIFDEHLKVTELNKYDSVHAIVIDRQCTWAEQFTST